MDDIIRRVVNTPAPEIRIDHVLVLDWYDGPIEGYLRLADPASCWKFKVIAVRRPEDDVDDRLYALSAAPDDVFDRLRGVLEPPDPAPGHLWIPSGVHGTEEERSAAARELDQLERALPDPALIVRSTYLNDVSAVWEFSDR